MFPYSCVASLDLNRSGFTQLDRFERLSCHLGSERKLIFKSRRSLAASHTEAKLDSIH
jgi:hypothetical protein